MKVAVDSDRNNARDAEGGQLTFGRASNVARFLYRFGGRREVNAGLAEMDQVAPQVR